MQELIDIDDICQLPYKNTTALILGEPRAGKTLLARYLSGFYACGDPSDNPSDRLSVLYVGVLQEYNGKYRVCNALDLSIDYTGLPVRFEKDLARLMRFNSFSRVFLTFRWPPRTKDVAELQCMLVKILDSKGLAVTIVYTGLYDDKPQESSVGAPLVDLALVDPKEAPEVAIRMKAIIDTLRDLM
jgi:hypothetical protein